MLSIPTDPSSQHDVDNLQHEQEESSSPQDPPELFPQKHTRERILLFILVNNIEWGFKLETGFVFHLFFFRQKQQHTRRMVGDKRKKCEKTEEPSDRRNTRHDKTDPVAQTTIEVHSLCVSVRTLRCRTSCCAQEKTFTLL